MVIRGTIATWFLFWGDWKTGTVIKFFGIYKRPWLMRHIFQECWFRKRNSLKIDKENVYHSIHLGKINKSTGIRMDNVGARQLISMTLSFSTFKIQS